MSNDLPDASQWLLYDPMFIDPTLPSGFWLCATAEDALAVSINAGVLRTGTSWEDLPKCEPFLLAFAYVLIVSADPARRAEMVREARARLPQTVLLVANDAGFRKCSCVRELRDVHGLGAVDRILLHTTELPGLGLLDIADVEQPDIANMPKIRSGIEKLDGYIGGYYFGELSVWTGKRGEGKSTILDQMLLESIEQGYPVCAYSGELAAWKFKYWATLQAAGPGHITETIDKSTGKRIPGVTPIVQARIDEWWRGRYLLYDIGKSARHDAKSILSAFDYARKKYGTKVFLVDNLMTAQFRGSRESDFYRAQSNFVGELVSFAKGHNVHVHLVAHPRKTQGTLGNDDVGGIGDITNMADNVFSIERPDMGDSSVEYKGKKSDTALVILKNRFMAASRSTVGLDFDKKSKRFSQVGTSSLVRHYGWEFDGVSQPTMFDVGVPEKMPF